jgi:diacylglycerol kinase family enzyme
LLGTRFWEVLAAKTTAIEFTKKVGDAERIAAQAQGYDGLVAVGGDGTVAEIVSGMDRATQIFSVIPAGTGNCLAKDLGLNYAISALDALAEGELRYIDLIETVLYRVDGSLSKHFLASTAGLGYSSDVALLAKRYFSRLRGYAYAASACFVRPKLKKIRVSIDNGDDMKLQLTGLLINNTRHIGSVQPFLSAAIDDGILDCFLFQSGWLKQCLHNIEMVTGIPIYGTPRSLHLKSLCLHFDRPETVMLDGELFEHVTGMDITCHNRGLTCMGAPRCKS